MSKTDTQKTTSKAEKNEVQLIGPNTVIELVIDKETALAAYNKALRKKAQNFKSDGFRRGKVPLALAETMIGSEAILEEALQKVVPPVYEVALKKSGKLPLTYPEFNPISLKKGEDWKLEAHVAEAPVVKLGDYTKIVKNAKKAALEHEKEQQKQQKEVEKAQKTTKKSENGESEAEPTESHSHAHTEQQQQDHMLQHIYADLVKEIKPQIPQLLVKDEVRGELDTLVRRLESLKLDLDGFLKQRGMTFEQLSEEFTYQALGRLQLTFILEAIVVEQKFDASQAEVDETIAKTEDKDLQKRQQSDPAYQRWLKQTIVRQKVVSHLLKI